MTYREAVEEALCFGWIDGIIRKIDAERFIHRFTPRKPGSIWSRINILRAEQLIAAGRMQPAGLAAFARRDVKRSAVYSFEQHRRDFPTGLKPRFRTHPSAWKFWLQQPPGYRRTVVWWVVSAKQEATRLRLPRSPRGQFRCWPPDRSVQPNREDVAAWRGDSRAGTASRRHLPCCARFHPRTL